MTIGRKKDTTPRQENGDDRDDEKYTGQSRLAARIEHHGSMEPRYCQKTYDRLNRRDMEER